MSRPEFKYDVIVKAGNISKRFEWGTGENWIDENRELLDNADSIGLISKDDNHKVVVKLDENKRFVVFTRVFGRLNRSAGTAREIRLYCVGWQSTIKGTNIKSLTWIYPNGMIENTEEPSFVNQFL